MYSSVVMLERKIALSVEKCLSENLVRPCARFDSTISKGCCYNDSQTCFLDGVYVCFPWSVICSMFPLFVFQLVFLFLLILCCPYYLCLHISVSSLSQISHP